MATSNADNRIEKLVARAALFDENTKLPVYSGCFDQLKHAGEDRCLGVVLIQVSDLDRLEALQGIERYESVLRHVAFQLQDAIDREYGSDLLLTQRGVFDDQFLVFLPSKVLADDEAATLERIAGRLYETVSTALTQGDFPVFTLRLGYAMLFYKPSLRFERQVHRIVEKAALLSQHRQEAELALHELEIQRILSRGEIRTVFQPIVSMGNGEVVGYEALARGPEGTPYQNPEALFTYARESKLASQLDLACKKNAVTRSSGKPGGKKLFINTLPNTLEGNEFLGDQTNLFLEKHGLSPGDVVWELTERSAIRDFNKFRTVIDAYKEMGYQVAIDDLGTGYSSIQTITHVHPQFLKIDISLVQDVHRNLLKQEVISSLLTLGRNVGAEVIAEGVETAEERDCLLKIGLTLGQGYLFGIPSADFPLSANLEKKAEEKEMFS